MVSVYNKESLSLQPTAQNITSGLWLGPVGVAKDLSQLNDLKITAVMSVIGPECQDNFDSIPISKKIWFKVTDRCESGQDMS